MRVCVSVGGGDEQRATCLGESTGTRGVVKEIAPLQVCEKRENKAPPCLHLHSSLSSPQALVRQATCRVIARSGGACLKKLRPGQTRLDLPTEVFDVSLFNRI